MIFFSKKKREETEEISAKPSHKRKKKEEKKQWGKKERLFVLTFFMLAVGISTFLSLSARSWKLPNLPRIRIPEVNIPFLKEETIVIEGRKKDQKKASNVIQAFTDATDPLTGVYGLYVIRLNSGFSYGVYEHDIFQAASLIKLPVIAGMYMEAEKGEIDLEDVYKLREADRRDGGELTDKPVGYEVSYRDLIRLMANKSDNTAYIACLNILGEERVKQVIDEVGMRDTSLDENETSPEDIGIFFEKLWNGELINEEHKTELLGYLTDTAFEDRIAAGIPEGVRVSHKIGLEVNVVNDAGVVYADPPFVLVIMSKGVVVREANDMFPELARVIYDIETNSK
jgi:beta-lactamase class A